MTNEYNRAEIKEKYNNILREYYKIKIKEEGKVRIIFIRIKKWI